MTYPANDDEFQDHTIKSVDAQDDGTYAITNASGWTLWCGKQCPVKPEVGMTARYYGGGLGSVVRGLFLNGTEVWYRTKDEHIEKSEIEQYGADAADWLARWDAGKGVWSIEMGGLGPGYEQCIQIVAAEVLRWLLANTPDLTSDWHKHGNPMEQTVSAVTEPLGLSGAQWGAGVNLAAMLYKTGPRGVMTDERVKDRHIQVRREFPQLAQFASASNTGGGNE